jgi:hypothetical protein
MRLGDTCQAHRCAGGRLRSTRITRTELAARNRRADFPAPQTSLTPQHVARSRRPRPSSTGTPREGSARQVSRTASRIVGVPVSSRNVATGWRRTGRPARRAGDSRDKRTVPSTEWGYLHPSAHRPRAPATGPGRGVEAVRTQAPVPETLFRDRDGGEPHPAREASAPHRSIFAGALHLDERRLAEARPDDASTSGAPLRLRERRNPHGLAGPGRLVESRVSPGPAAHRRWR